MKQIFVIQEKCTIVRNAISIFYFNLKNVITVTTAVENIFIDTHINEYSNIENNIFYLKHRFNDLLLRSRIKWDLLQLLVNVFYIINE